VFKDEAIEEGFDDSLFVGVELADGFELEAELVARVRSVSSKRRSSVATRSATARRSMASSDGWLEPTS